MDSPPDDLNTIAVNGRSLLLVETGGVAIHLASQVSEGRPAIPEQWLRPTGIGYADTITNYNAEGLLEARWSPRAMCGTAWQTMAATDIGPLRHGQEPQYAPTCRRCLTSMDRHFPTPSADGRTGLITALVAQAVEERGSAEILGVPGDQIKPLRAAIRREFQSRFGHNAKTWLVEDRLVVTCDEATEHVRLARAHEIIQSMHLGLPATVADDSGWRVHWQTWG